MKQSHSIKSDSSISFNTWHEIIKEFNLLILFHWWRRRIWRFKRVHKLWDCYFCHLTSQTCLRVHWLTLPDSGSPLRFAEFSSLDTDLWPAKCALHWLRSSPAPGRNLGTKQLQFLEWSNVKSQESVGDQNPYRSTIHTTQTIWIVQND